MAVMLRKLRALALLAVAFAGVPLSAQGETPKPVVPEATARFSETQGCVEPTPEMRKNHMKMMLHKRDQTMHEGIRTEQYSLDECINCHVPEQGAEGQPVRADSKEHFCNSCHSYAGVDIDCFQCHADRPVKKTGFHPLVGQTVPHHSDTGAGKGAISAGTLEVLAEEGKLQ